jgi:hypothetical protein
VKEIQNDGCSFMQRVLQLKVRKIACQHVTSGAEVEASHAYHYRKHRFAKRLQRSALKSNKLS